MGRSWCGNSHWSPCLTKNSKRIPAIQETCWTHIYNYIYMFFPKDVSSQGSSEDCWRISPHAYPTHIHSTRIPPIRIRSIRIHSMRIHSKCTRVSCQYVSFPYVSIQYLSHQYVAIRCVSIQKVCISRNGNVCECKTYPCISLHQQEWPCMWMQNISLHIIASAGMAMSMSIIACHFIPLLLGGNGNENRNLAFPSISLQLY